MKVALQTFRLFLALVIIPFVKTQDCPASPFTGPGFDDGDCCDEPFCCDNPNVQGCSLTGCGLTFTGCPGATAGTCTYEALPTCSAVEPLIECKCGCTADDDCAGSGVTCPVCQKTGDNVRGTCVEKTSCTASEPLDTETCECGCTADDDCAALEGTCPICQKTGDNVRGTCVEKTSCTASEPLDTETCECGCTADDDCNPATTGITCPVCGNIVNGRGQCVPQPDCPGDEPLDTDTCLCGCGTASDCVALLTPLSCPSCVKAAGAPLGVCAEKTCSDPALPKVNCECGCRDKADCVNCGITCPICEKTDGNTRGTCVAQPPCAANEPLDPDTCLCGCGTAVDCVALPTALSCPSCVKAAGSPLGVCAAKVCSNSQPCCKATAGNDLVCASGCGNGNVCFQNPITKLCDGTALCIASQFPINPCPPNTVEQCVAGAECLLELTPAQVKACLKRIPLPAAPQTCR